MFDHPDIEKYDFSKVPLDRDIYLMEEIWMEDLDRALNDLIAGKRYRAVGYISYAAARAIHADGIEISWYPNIYDRFHEVKVMLPRDQIVACIDSWKLDIKPYVFVKSAWLNDLHLRIYSTFVLVDAIGVKDALRSGALTSEKLEKLRSRLDSICSSYKPIAFISFADSLLIKINWRVGMRKARIRYSYKPELLFSVLREIREAYTDILGMKIFAIFAQGKNEYADQKPIHISKARNHISLNSLGLPFAQLLAMDAEIRRAIKSKIHDPYELYMDEDFYRSLNFSFHFDKREQPSHTYMAPMASNASQYFCINLDEAISYLSHEPALSYS